MKIKLNKILCIPVAFILISMVTAAPTFANSAIIYNSSESPSYVTDTTAKSVPVDLNKYNIPMSREEFNKVNAQYIKFLE